MKICKETFLFLKASSILFYLLYFQHPLFAFPTIPVEWKADSSEVILHQGVPVEVLLEGNVFLKSGDKIITADRVHYFLQKEAATVSGRVIILLPFGEIKTDQLYYNFQTDTGFTGPAEFTSKPWWGKVNRIEIAGRNQVFFYDGYFTTCDQKDPHYRITLQSAAVKKDELMQIKSATFRIGSLPIFYLPRFTQNLGDSQPFNLDVTPAISSRDGIQLFTSVGYSTPQSHYNLNLDFRGDRGFGLGPEWESRKWGLTKVKSYFIRDLDKGENRYRIEAWQKNIFRQENSGEGVLLLEVHKFSDPDFLKDYFWKEYVKDVERRTFISYSLNRKDCLASILAEGELDNHREPSFSHRLPEVSFFLPYRNWLGLYWQGEASLGRLSRDFSGQSKETLRLYLKEDVSQYYPFWTGILRPFLATGLIYYDQNKEKKERFRYLLQAGADLNWVIKRDFVGREGSERSFTHYLEPGFSLLFQDVNCYPEEFYFYDQLDLLEPDRLLTFRLLNRIDFTEKKETFEGVHFDLTADYSFKDSTFKNLRGLFLFDPRKNLQLRSEGEFDSESGHWRATSTSLDWHKGDFRAGLNHAYQKGEDETLSPKVSFPVGDKWRVDAFLSYNLKEDSFESKEISLWRDLHCWEGRFGIYQDEKETEIYFVFYLKAFPQESLKIKSHLY